MTDTLKSANQLEKLLLQQGYHSEQGLSTALFLAIKLKRPLFLEGNPGVGKTEIAKALAQTLNTELIRLQCYEGLDIHNAVYEWNYPKQILRIRLAEANHEKIKEADLFGEDFLLERPLLRSIRQDHLTILLIDEIDRSDSEFEAYLLETLSEYQISIPELGIVKSESPPVIIITSNRTREVHDALKRRCIYYWIDYPNREKELSIINSNFPEMEGVLKCQIADFMSNLREQIFFKMPGVSETLDWAATLNELEATEITEEIIRDTLGVILKNKEDQETFLSSYFSSSIP